MKLGDIIIVKPNSKILADGVMGTSSVNQSPITGESVLISIKGKAYHHWKIEYFLIINGTGVLEVKVIKNQNFYISSFDQVSE